MNNEQEIELMTDADYEAWEVEWEKMKNPKNDFVFDLDFLKN